MISDAVVKRRTSYNSKILAICFPKKPNLVPILDPLDNGRLTDGPVISPSAIPIDSVSQNYFKMFVKRSSLLRLVSLALGPSITKSVMTSLLLVPLTGPEINLPDLL